MGFGIFLMFGISLSVARGKIDAVDCTTESEGIDGTCLHDRSVINPFPSGFNLRDRLLARKKSITCAIFVVVFCVLLKPNCGSQGMDGVGCSFGVDPGAPTISSGRHH